MSERITPPETPICEHGNYEDRDCESCGRVVEGDVGERPDTYTVNDNRIQVFAVVDTNTEGHACANLYRNVPAVLQDWDYEAMEFATREAMASPGEQIEVADGIFLSYQTVEEAQ